MHLVVFIWLNCCKGYHNITKHLPPFTELINTGGKLSPVLTSQCDTYNRPSSSTHYYSSGYIVIHLQI